VPCDFHEPHSLLSAGGDAPATRQQSLRKGAALGRLKGHFWTFLQEKHKFNRRLRQNRHLDELKMNDHSFPAN
jgi:hypothetical protein